jgi:uncharacterized protein YbjT (DUF2867 family)
MIAVITGASGLVGSRVLQLLLTQGSISQVIALSRRPLGVSSPKLREVIVADFSELESHATALRGEVYFCCLGTTIKAAGSQAAFRRVDHDAVVGCGRIAKQHSARAFVLISAAGASPQSLVFYNRVKGEAEVALSALGLARLVIFQPGLLMGDREEPRPGERAAIHTVRALEHVIPTRFTRRFATPVSRLADRMLETGLRPGGAALERFAPKDI